MVAYDEALVNRLLKAPAPSVTESWEPEDAPYDAARLGISNDDVRGLIEIAREWNDILAGPVPAHRRLFLGRPDQARPAARPLLRQPDIIHPRHGVTPAERTDHSGAGAD